jgi:hypothetical protein
MKRKIVPIIVLLMILSSWLTGCRTAPAETELTPTVSPSLSPLSTQQPVEFVTATPRPPTVPPTVTPTARPPTVTSAPSPVPTPADTPAPEVQPKPAALEGLIVFPVFDTETGTYNIYSARPDGGDRKLVIEEASQPTLNSSGERIAYRSWAQSRGLAERGIEGGDEWRFDSFVEAARPVFSPDDQTIAFQSREAGENFAIYRTTGQTYEVLRREAFPIEGEAPDWTADGESLVYKGCWGDQCGLYMINLDGSIPQQITDNLSDTNPAVSPDGKAITFMSQTRKGGWDIYVMEVNGTGRKQLTDDPAADGLPTWSPDGQTIAFVSNRSGEWAMWAMNADGSDQRLLFALGGSIDGVVSVDAQNSNGWLEESIDWASFD